MARIEIVYFSGNGHTRKQAEAVHRGAARHGEARLWQVSEDGDIDAAAWEALDAADAIVLGSPTYMAGPAWQLKRVIDASSEKWMSQKWKDKLMGGFSTSGSLAGDKTTTLTYFATLAAQHGALWVSLGQPPANTSDATDADRNRLGSALGAMAQAPVDASPDQAPLAGDLESAETYGARIAQLAAVSGRVDDGARIAAQ